MANQQGGWYPDPSGDTSKLRYWDGAQWTNEYTDAPQAQPAMPQPQVAVSETTYSNPTSGMQAQVDQVSFQNQQQYASVNTGNQSLLKAAFVFNLLSPILYVIVFLFYALMYTPLLMGTPMPAQTPALLVFCALLLIPLAWMIPMTVHTWGIYKGTKCNTVGFGVCTLLFVSLIGGILLLVAGTSKPRYQ